MQTAGAARHAPTLSSLVLLIDRAINQTVTQNIFNRKEENQATVSEDFHFYFHG